MIARGRQSGLLVLGDLVWILASVPLASAIRLGPSWKQEWPPGFLPLLACVNAAVFLAAFHYSDLYEFRTLARERVLLARVARSLAVAVVSCALLYYSLPGLTTGRGILLLTAGLVGAWAYTSRTFLIAASRTALHERILIVGAGETAIEVGREILERRNLGYHLVGFLDQTAHSSELHPGVVGSYGDMVRICAERRIDRVLVCLKDQARMPSDALLHLRVRGVEVEDGASFWERLTGRIPVNDVTASWFIFGPGFRQPRMTLLAKRLLDVCVALVGLCLFAPVMMLVALAIAAEGGGPVLFFQERVGFKGRVFRLVKFRTMRADAEKDGPVWAREKDDRVTRLGRFLRTSRLDELPQFWNVLAGEMSMVGPRPERPFFVKSLSRSVPYYDMRHVVRPGVTGWAQVKYRYGASEEDAMRKLQYDLHYIKHLSIRRDLLVMFDTAKVVLLGEGSR